MFNSLINGLLFTIIPSVLVYRTLKVKLQKRNNNPTNSIRILSTFHATISSGLSIAYLNNIISQSNYIYTLPLVSSGFFLIDLAHITLYKRQYTRPILITYYIHHLISLIGLTYVSIYPYHLARAFLAELSTPFINLSWVLTRQGNKGIAYLFNGLVVLALFTTIRVCNVVDLMYNCPDNPTLMYRCATFTFLVLNLAWLQGLTRIYYTDLKQYLLK